MTFAQRKSNSKVSLCFWC